MRKPIHALITLITAIAFLLLSCEKEDNEHLLTVKGHVYDYTTGKPIQGVDMTCKLIEFIPWANYNYLDEQYETTTKDGAFKFQFKKPGNEQYQFQIIGPSHQNYISQGTSNWGYQFDNETSKAKFYLYPKGKIRVQLIKKDTTTSNTIVCKIKAVFEVPFVEPTYPSLPGYNELVELHSPEVRVKSGEPFWVDAKAYGMSDIELEIFEIVNGRQVLRETKNITVKNNQLIKQGITQVELSF